MEQEKDKNSGGWSLGLCMALGVMLGICVFAPSDNTWTGAGLGLLGGYVFYVVSKGRGGKQGD